MFEPTRAPKKHSSFSWILHSSSWQHTEDLLRAASTCTVLAPQVLGQCHDLWNLAYVHSGCWIKQFRLIGVKTLIWTKAVSHTCDSAEPELNLISTGSSRNMTTSLCWSLTATPSVSCWTAGRRGGWPQTESWPRRWMPRWHMFDYVKGKLLQEANVTLVWTSEIKEQCERVKLQMAAMEGNFNTSKHCEDGKEKTDKRGGHFAKEQACLRTIM